MQVLYITIVAKIHSKYKQIQRKRYGDVSVVEMYTTTEGAFGKQMDENPYWQLNYDQYFSETKGEMKMLYELEKSEGSRLFVPTPLFPCYRIRAFMEAMDKNYFSIFWER